MIACSPQGADGCGKGDGSGDDTAAEAGAEAEGASAASGLGAWEEGVADLPAEEWTMGLVAGGVTVDPVSGAFGRDKINSATTPATAMAMMATTALERILVPPDYTQAIQG